MLGRISFARVMDVPDGDAPAPAGVEGRAWNARGDDRRAGPTPRISRYAFFGGKRLSPRRTEEKSGSFVDRYPLRVALALTWIALMNIGDSFFTLTHLQSGGIELNPIAAWLLEQGRFGFVFTKCLLISLALLVLCLHKNFQLARAGLWLSAIAYTALFVYHMFLFSV